MTKSEWIDVAVAFGTLALAAAAFLQIWMEAHTRPRLTLDIDRQGIHTRLEGEPPRMPWIRLVVKNGHRKRTAHGARVVVQSFRDTLYDTAPVSLAGPELGWPSTSLREGDGAVIFGGASRPLDFGALGAGPIERETALPVRVPDLLAENEIWSFRFALAMHTNETFIGREFLAPKQGGYTARLTLGADEGEARDYDVKFNWSGNVPTPAAVLESFEISVKAVGS